MGYKILQLELTKPFEPIRLAEGETGVGLVARWNGRLIGFKMLRLSNGAELSAQAQETIADGSFAMQVLTAKIEAERPAPQATALPSLTIAICTKDRAVRLSRLLTSLVEIRSGSPFAQTEILVIDNASVDDATRAAVATFADVRYVFEPKAGLNFARNAALTNATGDILAFLDDDVVVDRHYLQGLAIAERGAPDAGGFTGLVMPFKLETDAQIAFEDRGGFGRGFSRRVFHATSFNYPLHPSGAGLMGAGCNMAFDRRLVESLGGFDDALDTGRPLPGGGDLDIFYRVLRSGRPMIYEPRYAVYHEHRETIDQLRHQYWTWGLGMMAFLVKEWRNDAANRPQMRALVRWWLLDQIRAVIGAALSGQRQDFRFRFAELIGGIQGYFGEYDRSQARVAAIRSAQP
jgi:glycosyltransferase involved in cell wall biosynthesis